MSSPKLNNISRDQVRELSAHEVGLVAGAKVLEIPIGPITIQLNFDNGCWAVWNGKDFAGGGLSEVIWRRAESRNGQHDRRRLDHRCDGVTTNCWGCRV